MHLTRFGYNLLVAIYIIPMIVVDFVGNTMSMGVQSDIYYFKMIFDGLLLLYAGYTIFTAEETAHRDVARQRVNDKNDDVVNFENVGAIEHIYCAVLVLYAAGNWFFFHKINSEATGFLSIVTLLWSFLSVVVAGISAVQFWHLKSGNIVALKNKMTQ